MSWDLPARCEVTAKTLQTKATLMGGAFKVNEEPDPPPAAGRPPGSHGRKLRRRQSRLPVPGRRTCLICSSCTALCRSL